MICFVFLVIIYFYEFGICFVWQSNLKSIQFPLNWQGNIENTEIVDTGRWRPVHSYWLLILVSLHVLVGSAASSPFYLLITLAALPQHRTVVYLWEVEQNTCNWGSRRIWNGLVLGSSLSCRVSRGGSRRGTFGCL